MSVDYNGAFADLNRIANTLEEMSASITKYIDREGEMLEKENKNFQTILEVFQEASQLSVSENNAGVSLAKKVKKVDPFNLKDILK